MLCGMQAYALLPWHLLTEVLTLGSSCSRCFLRGISSLGALCGRLDWDPRVYPVAVLLVDDIPKAQRAYDFFRPHLLVDDVSKCIYRLVNDMHCDRRGAGMSVALTSGS